MQWIEETGYARVDFSDQPQALSNLNSPEDIAAVASPS
jgi:molybdopterin-guanine dinucleotide biosynthesis protein A